MQPRYVSDVISLYEVLKVYTFIIPDSSMVEHTAVNRGVVGSSPTRGVFYGPMVKRLRHRPFTAVTRVRFPLGSLPYERIGRYGSIGRAADL